MLAAMGTQVSKDARLRGPARALLVIEEPVLRLVSVDLGARADISNLAEVFDFAKDYLGLLKAAVIASGIVPPGSEGSGQSLTDLLAEMRGERVHAGTLPGKDDRSDAIICHYPALASPAQDRQGSPPN